MADKFEKRLVVGKTDTYTYTVNTQWLGSETITSHTVTVDGKVTKNSSGVTDNVIGVSLTGVSTGASEIHFDYTTSGNRTDCKTIILVLVDNCY